MKKIILIAVIQIISTLQAVAFEQLINYDTPRVAALGGAYIAISDDASALFYNPAGLGLLNNEKGSIEIGGEFYSYEWDADTLTQWNNWKKSDGYFIYWENQGVFGINHRVIGDDNKTLLRPDSTGKSNPIITETMIAMTSAEPLSNNLWAGVRGIYLNLKSDYWDKYIPKKHIGIVESGLLYMPNSSIKSKQCDQ